MKTTAAKIGLLSIAIVAAIGFCSFKTQTPTAKTEIKTTGDMDDEWTEWNKVHDFVDKKIVMPLEATQKENSISLSRMSRCPSGYNSAIATKNTDIKLDSYTYGKVNYYNGCSPSYVCDFKVCVAKNEALVKTKGMTNYIPVSDWLKTKDKGAIVKN